MNSESELRPTTDNAVRGDCASGTEIPPPEACETPLPEAATPCAARGAPLGNENARKHGRRASVPKLPRAAKSREYIVNQLRDNLVELTGGKPTLSQDLLIQAACRQENLVAMGYAWLCAKDEKLSIEARLETVAAIQRAEESRSRILIKLGLQATPNGNTEPDGPSLADLPDDEALEGPANPESPATEIAP